MLPQQQHRPGLHEITRDEAVEVRPARHRRPRRVASVPHRRLVPRLLVQGMFDERTLTGIPTSPTAFIALLLHHQTQPHAEALCRPPNGLKKHHTRKESASPSAEPGLRHTLRGHTLVHVVHTQRLADGIAGSTVPFAASARAR